MPCSVSCDVKLFSKLYLCHINHLQSEVCSLTNKILLFFTSTFCDCISRSFYSKHASPLRNSPHVILFTFPELVNRRCISQVCNGNTQTSFQQAIQDRKCDKKSSDNHDDIKYWKYKLTSANPGSRLATKSIIKSYRSKMFTHKS